MIETAKAILEVIGGWTIDDTPAMGISGPSFLATKRGVGRAVMRQRVIVAEEAEIDVSAWVAAEGADKTTLFILAANDTAMAIATALREEASRLGGVAEAMRRDEFLETEVGLPRIRERYAALRKEYDESEGGGAIYIDPIAVDEDVGRTATLFSWADRYAREGRGGLVLLAAEYGEGKTSFCLNFVFRAMGIGTYATKWNVAGRGVPLLFLLNECDAGSLEQFSLARLREDYGLNVTFDGFRRLCALGVFIPVFDAFDQMGHGAGGLRTERDFGCLQALRSTKSPVYVTCRLNFFDQHMKALFAGERADAGPDASPRVLSWRGLDDQSLEEMLGERRDLLALLTAAENREALGGIHHKPLILHVIATHEAAFRSLLEKRRGKSDARPIAEFDIFDLLFQGWLKGIGPEFGSRDDATRLCRAVTAKARLDGMNLLIALPELAGDESCRALFETPERAERTREALARLPLLDLAKLNRTDRPIVVFRFNIYLEFMIARFVLDDLRSGRTDKRAPIKIDPLTLETRRIIVRALEFERHGAGLVRTIESTRFRDFRDVEYQGGNALSLLLDALRSPDVPIEDKEAWRRRLSALPLTNAVLRRLDARGAVLTGIDFANADLGEADFSYATLRNVGFARADLRDTRFQESGALLTTAFVRADGAEGWRVVGGTENGMLVVWDAGSPFPTRGKPHTDSVTGIGVPAAGTVYVSASRDGTLAETAVADFNAARSYPLGMGALRAVALVEDGDVVIVAGDREYVLVRSSRGGASHRLTLPSGDNAVVSCLAADGARGRLFAGTSNGDLVLFDDWSRECRGRVWGEALDARVRTVIAFADGSVLALSETGRPTLFDGQGVSRPDVVTERRMDAVTHAAAADSLFWVEERSLWERRWTAAGGERPVLIGRLPEGIKPGVLSCSPDGVYLAIGGDRLVVLRRGHLGLEIVRNEPMHMDCTGLALDEAKGLSEATTAFLVERGA